MTEIAEQIQTLLEPPVASTSYKRTLDYLDETYDTFDADGGLDGLDEEVASIRSTLDDLENKLRLSDEAVQRDITQTLRAANKSITFAKELALTRHALADQLAALTDELLPATSPGKGNTSTLLEDLEGLHVRLKELEQAKTYVSIMERALQLGEEAVKEVETVSTDPFSQSALGTYITLQEFVGSVVDACAQGASNSASPVTLVTFLEAVRDKTWKDIYTVLSSHLLTAAEALKWPQPVEYAAEKHTLRNSFKAAFQNLILLQHAGEKIHPPSTEDDLKKNGLYPLQALVQPIALRFKFHFDSTRQTNRIDKPEWYFTHMLNVFHEHKSFMERDIQGLLANTPYKDINAYAEFIRIGLNLPARKLRRSIPPLLNTPSLLAHTIYQTLLFDGSIRDGGFDMRQTWEGRGREKMLAKVREMERHEPREKKKGKEIDRKKERTIEWEGLSEVVLGKKEWFDAWLEGEKKFAEDQYNDIISSPDAWAITNDNAEDLDDVSPSEEASRSTNAARRFKALIASITERYQSLPHLMHRASFLFTIQLPLLDSYMSRITSSLDAYETLSSSFVRAVPGALAGQVGHGVDTRRLTSGVDGLTRLVKALLSADGLRTAMQSWGEELFFLEIWNDIQENPVLRAKADHHRSLPQTRSSSSSKEDRIETALFDKLVKIYETIVHRAEDMVVKQSCAEIEGELKPYFQTLWDKTGQEVSEPNALSIPATLVSPISLLSSELSFLARNVPPTTVTNIYRRVATTISNHIIQRAVAHRGRNQFTSEEGITFAAECNLWLETSRMALSTAKGPAVRRADLPWITLLDAAAIVGVPPESYAEVEKAIFDGDEESFSNMMSRLGSKNLTREGAIGYLRARVECRR